MGRRIRGCLARGSILAALVLAPGFLEARVWGLAAGALSDGNLGLGWTTALSTAWRAEGLPFPASWELGLNASGYESTARLESPGQRRSEQALRLTIADLRLNLLINHRLEGRGPYIANGMALGVADFSWQRRETALVSGSVVRPLEEGNGRDLALMFNFALGWRFNAGMEARMDVPVFAFTGPLAQALYPGPLAFVPVTFSIQWRP